MIERTTTSNRTDDDRWLEALLREDAETAMVTAAVADHGFTAALMENIPIVSQKSRYSWIIPAMGITGFVVGLVLLSGGEELSWSLAAFAQMRSLSLANLLFAVVPLGVLYWIALGAAWQEN